MSYTVHRLPLINLYPLRQNRLCLEIIRLKLQFSMSIPFQILLIHQRCFLEKASLLNRHNLMIHFQTTFRFNVQSEDRVPPQRITRHPCFFNHISNGITFALVVIKYSSLIDKLTDQVRNYRIQYAFLSRDEPRIRLHFTVTIKPVPYNTVYRKVFTRKSSFTGNIFPHIVTIH